MALRNAGKALGRHLFEDGVMYASSAPCPLCLVACYWARLPRLIFGASSKPGGRVVNDGSPLIDVGEIKSVFVRQDRRGRDVAAGLYLHACAVAKAEGWPASIDHSARRTSEGDSWARKMVAWYGGYLPELENGNFRVPPEGACDW